MSYQNKHDFVINLCQYVALERVGISFGHLTNVPGAIVIGGFINFAATELAQNIRYNSTNIQTVMGIEKNVIGIAAIVGKKGKSVLPTIFKLIGGNQQECLKP